MVSPVWQEVIIFRRIPPGSPTRTVTCPKRHRSPAAAYACGARSLRSWVWVARTGPVSCGSAFSHLALDIREVPQ
jgi:hypothetical protein